MKKIFLIILLIHSVLVVSAQSFEFTVENSKSDLVDILNPKDKYKDYKVYGFIKNTSAVTQKYIWVVKVIDKPSNWIFTVCDPVSCTPSLNSSGFELTAGQSGTFDMGTIAQGFTGKATYTASIYPENKIELAKQIDYTFTINDALATETQILEKSILIGPNPFSNNINIVNASNVQLQKIQIVNLQGITVYENQLSSQLFNYTLSLESLQVGTYYATFTSSNGSTSKMITKQ
jgi:hypothetical protein